MEENTDTDPAVAMQRLARELEALKASLGARYWSDAHVLDGQARLRRLLGAYAAWGEDRPPLHQRARKQAQFESQFAHLLWPGRETDTETDTGNDTGFK